MFRHLALLALLGACTPAGEAPIYTSFDTGEIGGPCAADGDCKGGGSCLIDNFLGYTGAGSAPPGGYCTRTCTADSDCGSGRCVPGLNNLDYCVAFCDGPSHCRTDYICRPNQHCEPQALYTFDCDPDADQGNCTLTNGSAGGCIRNALGEGMAGACILACSLNVPCPTSGTQKSGCHYFDTTTTLGDPFQGLLCYFDDREPTIAVGGACSSQEDCVSGANCVNVGGGSECLQLCNAANFCSDGSCHDFIPPGPYGACEP